MMRSLYSGVSGLKTHQVRMDVIGNNIANVNTVAYKSSSVTFSELMYQTTQKASGANATTGAGGVNARQVGLGVKTGAINTSISTSGAAQTTSNPFDIRITGKAFFVVSDGADNYFTRDGSFYVDGAGNLAMTSNGYNVMGWGVDPTTGKVKPSSVQALQIMNTENMTYPAEATSKAYVAGILDKNDTSVTSDSGRNMNLSFYDAKGYSYTAKYTINDSTTAGSYYVTLTDILDDSTGKSVIASYPGATSITDIATFGSGTTAINDTETATYTLQTGYTYAAGVYTKTATAAVVTALEAFGITDSATDNITYSVGAVAVGPPVTAPITKTTAYTNASLLKFNTDTGKFTSIDGGKSVVIDFKATAGTASTSLGNFADITVDFSNASSTNNSGSSTIAAKAGDTDGLGTGRKLGTMSSISISTNGMIYASYDNGQDKLLGQIATAVFSNASGLEKKGDNLYSATLNSGAFDGQGVDITSESGYMTTGELEMSNVDLSSEFTEMITTQRGFQANSRIITVSDTMLEELVNLKR